MVVRSAEGVSETDAAAMANATAGDALRGRVVLVTGAHGGLGSAAALACARAGATVVLLGRKVPKLNRLYDAMRRRRPEPLLYPLDLEGASPDDYAELARRIEAELGRLDGVLHCAAEFRGLTPLEHTDPAAFARAMHVNLTAPWWLTQACLPLLASAARMRRWCSRSMIRRGSGRRSGAAMASPSTDSAALVAMLHAELGEHFRARHGLQPGPMRTALRAKAYVEDGDRECAGSVGVRATPASRCLSPLGAAHRGTVVEPPAAMTIASAALLLFLILDPLGNIPVFLSLLKPLPPARQRVVLARELLIALAVLMVFLWGGKYALEVMHLRQESVSIAGGIVLFLIGIRMIFPPPEGLMGELPDGEPFIVPMAIPLVAGPSGMAAVMLMGSNEPGRHGRLEPGPADRLGRDRGDPVFGHLSVQDGWGPAS